MGKRVDGLVVTARRADLRTPIAPPGRALPVVYVFSRVESSDALCLLPDDEGGAVLATEHLLSLGRRRIGHITGPERSRRSGSGAWLAPCAQTARRQGRALSEPRRVVGGVGSRGGGKVV